MNKAYSAIVALAVLAADGSVLSDNIYWQGVEGGNYQALRALGKARLSMLRLFKYQCD